MAGSIDMVPEGLPMGRSSEDEVQKGGGSGSIDMYGGDGVSLKHSPLGSEQSGKGDKGIDMIGEQGMLDRKITTPYGSKYPSDKGHL